MTPHPPHRLGVPNLTPAFFFNLVTSILKRRYLSSLLLYKIISATVQGGHHEGDSSQWLGTWIVSSPVWLSRHRMYIGVNTLYNKVSYWNPLPWHTVRWQLDAHLLFHDYWVSKCCCQSSVGYSWMSLSGPAFTAHDYQSPTTNSLKMYCHLFKPPREKEISVHCIFRICRHSKHKAFPCSGVSVAVQVYILQKQLWNTQKHVSFHLI